MRLERLGLHSQWPNDSMSHSSRRVNSSGCRGRVDSRWERFEQYWGTKSQEQRVRQKLKTAAELWAYLLCVVLEWLVVVDFLFRVRWSEVRGSSIPPNERQVYRTRFTWRTRLSISSTLVSRIRVRSSDAELCVVEAGLLSWAMFGCLVPKTRS